MASFSVGGAVIALLGAVLLAVLVRAGTAALLAQAIQLTVTLALNFAYNYEITWRHRPRTGLPRQVAWFLLTRGMTLAAGWLAFAGLTALGLEYELANLLCLAGTTAVNFVASDKLVFPSQEPRPGRPPVRHWRTMLRSALRWAALPWPGVVSAAKSWAARPRRVTLASTRWCVRHWRRVLVLASVAAGITGAWSALRLPVLPTLLLGVAGFNLMVAGLETRWRLYGWRTPEAAAQMAWPAPVAPGAERMTFSLIIPVRDDATVIGDTLGRLLKQSHPRYRIVVSLCDDDEASIAAVRAVTRGTPEASRITTVVAHYDQPSKPQQLNRALGSCAADVVGVIDAEDDVAEDLLAHVEALFLASGAEVVQGGVQLMNLGTGLAKWFQVHNVLEYFFWFTSRMAYQARAGFVPLGGNTVFIRRELLVAAGGWPLSLTEDCALGVLLATEFGAEVVTAYSPALATREESPPSIFNKKAGSLFWQRDRWVRGFLAEFMTGRWLKMATLRQRALAGYILGTPLLQAVSCVLLPLAAITGLVVKTPIAIAMLVFAPFLPIGLTVLAQLIGLRDFGRLYRQRVSAWHYASVLVLTPLYQILLAAAAATAAFKYAAGDTTWYKTGRAGEHRREAPDPSLEFTGAIP